MKRSPLILAILLFMGGQSTAIANLDQSLNQMFDSMVNTTGATAQLGQRRGVLSGGSLIIRNRITTAQPITMTPPAVAGGCSGIDLYGGSFSFINQAQFVTLLRSIAANAGGYAFQLGINAMCPDCGSLMSDLQKKVQSLNEHFANSCQLAQGVVNDTLSAMDVQQQNRLSQISLASGVGDVFQSFTHASGTSSSNPASQAPGYASTITGNLMWRALMQGQAGGWFQFGGTDVLETLMSVTGTVIVSAPDGTRATPIRQLPSLIGIRELINGNATTAANAPVALRYQCDTTNADGCLNPTTMPIEVQGFRARIESVHGGTDGTGGLISKFSTGSGQLTAAEMGFMELAPAAMGALIRNLAREDPGLARLFVQRASPVLALELAGELVQGMASTAREMQRLSPHAYASLLDRNVDSAIADLREERRLLDQQFGTLEGLIAHYEGLMQTGRPKDYGVSSALAGGSRRSAGP